MVGVGAVERLWVGEGEEMQVTRDPLWVYGTINVGHLTGCVWKHTRWTMVDGPFGGDAPPPFPPLPPSAATHDAVQLVSHMATRTSFCRPVTLLDCFWLGHFDVVKMRIRGLGGGGGDAFPYIL